DQQSAPPRLPATEDRVEPEVEDDDPRSPPQTRDRGDDVRERSEDHVEAAELPRQRHLAQVPRGARGESGAAAFQPRLARLGFDAELVQLVEPEQVRL